MSIHGDALTLTYGQHPWKDILVVVSREVARTRADEYTRLRQCKTRREAVLAAASVREVDIDFSDWEWSDEELDETFDFDADVPGVDDGDFPPMPEQYALDTFDEDETWYSELLNCRTSKWSRQTSTARTSTYPSRSRSSSST